MCMQTAAATISKLLTAAVCVDPRAGCPRPLQDDAVVRAEEAVSAALHWLRIAHKLAGVLDSKQQQQQPPSTAPAPAGAHATAT